jgi:pantoate--beta-alanine ligase
MTRVFTTTAEWLAARRGAQLRGASVGFVPTMGALHAGHLALLERARCENDHVVLSIFVNPTQFDNPDDLARYPASLAADVALAGGRADSILAPSAADLYPDGYAYRLSERDLARKWEGEHRPGHFDGVLTVVLKLLNLVRPRRAYFGEKDWQQLRLVQGMARALFLDTEIVACPIVRDTDGLALSSRNARLSASGRAIARQFPRILREAPDPAAAAAGLREAGLAVDYVDEADGVRLGAVRVEGVRLIDNVRR